MQVLHPVQAAVMLIQAGPDFLAPLTIAELAGSTPASPAKPAAPSPPLLPIELALDDGTTDLDPMLWDPFDVTIAANVLPMPELMPACKCGGILCCTCDTSWVQPALAIDQQRLPGPPQAYVQ